MKHSTTRDPFTNPSPRSRPRWAAVLLAASTLVACDDDEGGLADVVVSDGVFAMTVDGETIASLPEVAPAVDPDEAELGWLLFWDPVLSGGEDVACATCHLPEHGYSDGLRASIGVGGTGRGSERVGGPEGRVPRNAPGVINTVFNGIDDMGHFDVHAAPMFWDNRATGLEEQALGPVRSDIEMRGTEIAEGEIWAEVVARVNAIPEYRDRFDRVYGAPATPETVVQAIAAFESTIVANNSPFDQWMRGDSSALTPQQVEGMEDFFDAGCATCHNGPMFSDFELHVLAAPDGPWVSEPDRGDGEFAFRTPTLRQLEFTGPYFHGGHVDSIEDAVEFYEAFEELEDDGDTDELNPAVPLSMLDEDLEGPDGDQEENIAAFLRALSDPDFFQEEPASVPSGLAVGGFAAAP